MIREATILDLAPMTEMGVRFHETTPWKEYAGFCRQSFAETLSRLICDDSALVIVMEDDGNVVGMAAGMLLPLYFNKHITTVQELFCWVEPESRGAGMLLFAALEEWGAAQGAKAAVYSLVPNEREEAMARLYRAQGCEHTDSFFTKRIGG